MEAQIRKEGRSKLCPKSATGKVSRPAGRIGFDAWSLAVGHISVDIAAYDVTWKNNGSTAGFANISFWATRTLSFTDKYTFNGHWYNPVSWVTDIIPSWYAGPGKDFDITGSWTDNPKGDFNICCWGY